MAYVYKGDRPDTVTVRTRTVRPFDPSKCGTPAGYSRHQKHATATETKIDACAPCRAAMAARSQQIRDAKAAA